MTRVPRTAREQWAVLRAVVELGGFAPAADHLNRSQSSVSYAVDRLEGGWACRSCGSRAARRS